MQITFEKFLLLIVYFFGIYIFMKVDRFFSLSVGFSAAATAETSLEFEENFSSKPHYKLSLPWSIEKVESRIRLIVYP